MLLRAGVQVPQVTYRWIEGMTATEDEWNRIDEMLLAHGCISLNRPTSRIRVAEFGRHIIALIVLQFVPHVGPLIVIPDARGSGVAEKLADDMLEFLTEVEARGWVVVASNAHVEKLCRERGMKKLESPVYTAGGEV